MSQRKSVVPAPLSPGTDDHDNDDADDDSTAVVVAQRLAESSLSTPSSASESPYQSPLTYSPGGTVTMHTDGQATFEEVLHHAKGKGIPRVKYGDITFDPTLFDDDDNDDDDAPRSEAATADGNVDDDDAPRSEAATADGNVDDDDDDDDYPLPVPLSEAATALLARASISNWKTEEEHELLVEILLKRGDTHPTFEIVRVHNKVKRHCLVKISTGDFVFCYKGNGKITKLSQLKLDPKTSMIPLNLKSFLENFVLDRNPVVFADGSPKFLNDADYANGKPRFDAATKDMMNNKETMGRLGNTAFKFNCGQRAGAPDNPMTTFLASHDYTLMKETHQTLGQRKPGPDRDAMKIDDRLAFDFPQPSEETRPSDDDLPPFDSRPFDFDSRPSNDGGLLGGSRGPVALPTFVRGRASASNMSNSTALNVSFAPAVQFPACAGGHGPASDTTNSTAREPDGTRRPGQMRPAASRRTQHYPPAVNNNNNNNNSMMVPTADTARPQAGASLMDPQVDASLMHNAPQAYQVASRQPPAVAPASRAPRPLHAPAATPFAQRTPSTHQLLTGGGGGGLLQTAPRLRHGPNMVPEATPRPTQQRHPIPAPMPRVHQPSQPVGDLAAIVAASLKAVIEPLMQDNAAARQAHAVEQEGMRQVLPQAIAARASVAPARDLIPRGTHVNYKRFRKWGTGIVLDHTRTKLSHIVLDDGDGEQYTVKNNLVDRRL